MTSIKKGHLPNIVEKGFLFGILLGLILVLLSKVLVPPTGLLNVAGALFALIVYGLLGYFLFSHTRPEVLTSVIVFGLLAGLIFAGEILIY